MPRVIGAVLLLLLLVGGAAVAFGVSRTAPDPNRGAQLFATVYTPTQGLGPLFNETSCVGCHNTPSPGGTGPDGLSTVLRVGKLSSSGFDPLIGRGGPVARAHSIAELGASCPLAPGVPAGANVTSVRNAPQLFGDGAMDAIPDAVITAGAIARDGVQGRPNLVNGRVGRFGWKADTATLTQFVGEAFRNELGMTNPVAPLDLVPPGVCGGGGSSGPKVDVGAVNDVVAFIDNLPRPQPGSGDASVFETVGCASCHVANLGGVPLYSDLLLHDMGGALDDGVVQGGAAGHDWRTAPLWGLGGRQRFLHDGRARSLDAAIKAHGGEAMQAVQRYTALSETDRSALIAFLGRL